MPKFVTDEEMVKRIIKLDNGCWRYPNKLRPDGYVQHIRSGKVCLAHRTIYTILKGTIPDGLDLDHLCRNRYCCNPSHLEPVTRIENVRRGNAGKIKRETTHCPSGHPYDDKNTCLDKYGYRMCKTCRYNSHKKWLSRKKTNQLRQCKYTI